ncbi:MAG: STAS domain-containing protein [Candidatus Rokuibacteriota bacterium]
MPPRLRVRTCVRDGCYVLRFDGEVDGSSACRVLDILAHTPRETREIVLDLSALTGVDAFGLEVLSRGLRQITRERRVRIQASPKLLPVLSSLAGSLLAKVT